MKELFVPGRTELAGNHTDHQNGRILASAVDLGLFASFEANGENLCRVASEGFPSFEVRTSPLNIRTTEFGTSQALVRGVMAAFQDLGLRIGGFDAQIRSTLPAGSGLSSSAGFSASFSMTARWSPLCWPGLPSRRRISISASPAA